MTRATRRWGRSGVASLAALATVGGALIVGAGSAGATSSATTNTIAGSDRYATAAQLADKAFPSGAASVVLASGNVEHFPDALAGNYLAGQVHAPILLADTNLAELPGATVTELVKLKPTTVYVLGDRNAVPTSQTDQLASLGYTVTRLGGSDRFATDKLIAEHSGASAVGLVNGMRTAIVANSQKFPDALSAGPLVFASHLPVVITPTTSLNTNAQAILQDLSIQQVIIVGDEKSISASTASAINALGISTLVRLGGVDRSDTSRLIAEWELAHANFSNTAFTIATGDNSKGGADALAAGPFGGVNKTPVLVTNSTNDPGSVVAYAKAHASTLTAITILGTSASVPTSIGTQVLAAARGLTSSQAFTLTPASATTVTVSSGSPSDNKGVVNYTATGLGTDKVDIVLVADGQLSGTVLSHASGATVASLTAAGAGRITVVNGVGTGSVSQIDGVTPIGGSVSFTVDSTVTGQAIPVVYSAADGNDTLSVDASGVPTENFGVGGEITWTAAAGSGSGSGTSSPAAPASVSIPSPADTSAMITVASGLVSGATINAYIAVGSGAFSTATMSASSATDADPGKGGFQIQVTGLTASTGYTAYVTQTVGGIESLPSAGVAFTTIAPTDSALTISSATVADVNDGTGSSLTLKVTFSEALVSADNTGISVNPTSQPANSDQGLSFGTVSFNTDRTVATYTLTNALNDVTPDVSYTVTIAPGSVTTATGPNAKLTATFSY